MNTPDTTSAGHTPTPKYWIANGGNVFYVKSQLGYLCKSIGDGSDAESNMKLIVEACNSHDTMKAALSQWWQGMKAFETLSANECVAIINEAKALTRAFFEGKPVQESVEVAELKNEVHENRMLLIGCAKHGKWNGDSCIGCLEEEVEALKAERDELAAWKREEMAVTSECDMQKLANLLGLVFGQRIYPNIIPKVEQLLSKLTAYKKLVESLPHSRECHALLPFSGHYSIRCTCWKSKIPTDGLRMCQQEGGK